MGSRLARWILGLLLAGLAADMGFRLLARSRSRSRTGGNASVSPTPDLSKASPVTGPASSPSPEPWLESLRLVMEKSPYEFGFDKGAWSAPLLSRYMRDTRGIDVPLPLLRKGLKDLGYRWDQTHYVRANPVEG